MSIAGVMQVALRWFCSRSLLRAEGLTKELIDRIPGKQTDRKTPLGELNWIFTAITDTIAWNMLPRSLFQRLFRQVSPVVSCTLAVSCARSMRHGVLTCQCERRTYHAFMDVIIMMNPSLLGGFKL